MLHNCPKWQYKHLLIVFKCPWFSMFRLIYQDLLCSITYCKHNRHVYGYKLSLFIIYCDLNRWYKPKKAICKCDWCLRLQLTIPSKCIIFAMALCCLEPYPSDEHSLISILHLEHQNLINCTKIVSFGKVRYILLSSTTLVMFIRKVTFYHC